MDHSNGHIPVVEPSSDEAKAALPASNKSLGRPAKNGRAGWKEKLSADRLLDPRTMQDWTREVLEWALAHDGVLDLPAYREEKFAQDYKGTGWSHTRGPSTVSYMAGPQKVLKGNGKGVYKLLPKGERFAADLGIVGNYKSNGAKAHAAHA